jgi:hypothetical protein
MEGIRSNEGQGLGIVGLVLGIMSIIFGIIPCTFIIALFFGVIGIIFGSVAYTQAQKSGGTTGLPIGALTVSIVGTCLALLMSAFIFSNKNINIKNIQKNIKRIEEKAKTLDKIDKTFENFDSELEDVLKELEDSLEIKVDIQINKALEGLSKEEKAKKIGKAAGKAVKEFLKEVGDTAKVNP